MFACKHYQKMLYFEKSFGWHHIITLVSLIFSFLVVLRFVSGTEWIVTMTILLLSCLASILTVRTMNLFSKILKGLTSSLNFILLVLCAMVLFNIAIVNNETEGARIILQKCTLWPNLPLVKLTDIWKASAFNSFSNASGLLTSFRAKISLYK